MRILLINQAFVSPNEPGHTRHYELATFMKRTTGDEMVIVASDVNYQTGQKVVEQHGIFTKQIIRGIEVYRAWVLSALHRSFVWRVLSFISFMFSSVWTSFQTGHIDVVMGTSPPIFQAAAAWLVAFLRRKPFLLEVRDLMARIRDRHGRAEKSPAYPYVALAGKLSLPSSPHRAGNSPAYRDYMLAHGVPAEKVRYIPYGTDIEMFTPEIDGKPFRQKLGLDDKVHHPV